MLRLTGWNALVGLLFAATLPVCAQFAPPTESAGYAAKVVTLTGSVSLLRDHQPWALSPGDVVQVKQIIVSGPDGHAVFQVSDGSTFEVFPNSHVVFRKNAPNWRDLIDVIVGRVKVHIEHWGNQPNPNRVFTPTAVISVRGTTFDISVDEESESTLVEVVDGEVEVSHALVGGNSRILRTGESLTVYRTIPLEARLIDKGTIFQHALRSLMDALQTIATRTPRGGIGGIGGGGGVGGGTGGASGDTGKPVPPPAPPPPPPSPVGP
jgi:ferric-dicitrate binding protein FerR (iron transport regulator)